MDSIRDANSVGEGSCYEPNCKDSSSILFANRLQMSEKSEFEVRTSRTVSVSCRVRNIERYLHRRGNRASCTDRERRW